MRLVLFTLLASLAAMPVRAQPLSPMTGTTSTPPAEASGPAARAPSGERTRRPRVPLQQRFDAANTTHDGKLTLEQARTGHMPQVVRSFDAIDAGHKGYVTEAEIVAYRKAARAARKAAAKP